MEHEWETDEINGGPAGFYTLYRCKNCGGVVGDLFFNPLNKPKKIRIPGAGIYLTQDCLESLKIMQTYWEKQTKKKSLYKKRK